MTPFVSDPQRATRQVLADWSSAGVTYLKPVEAAATAHHVKVPVNVVPPSARTVPTRIDESPVPDAVNPPTKTSMPARFPVEPMTESIMSRTQRQVALQSLADVVSTCTRCPELAAARTQTVFGVGNPEARVMFVGEAPGADEDAQGEPFVGKAGQLLNKIIEACGWKREELYICNILRCRPPGNRNPTSEEAANCREYLDGQIRLVDPDYIVCWGSVAAWNLLDESTPIGKLRQRWFSYGRAKVLCTYHPSYLLRNSSAKKPVWDDMKFLLAEMGQEPPASSRQ